MTSAANAPKPPIAFMSECAATPDWVAAALALPLPLAPPLAEGLPRVTAAVELDGTRSTVVNGFVGTGAALLKLVVNELALVLDVDADPPFAPPMTLPPSTLMLP